MKIDLLIDIAVIAVVLLFLAALAFAARAQDENVLRHEMPTQWAGYSAGDIDDLVEAHEKGEDKEAGIMRKLASPISTVFIVALGGIAAFFLLWAYRVAKLLNKKHFYEDEFADSLKPDGNKMPYGVATALAIRLGAHVIAFAMIVQAFAGVFIHVYG